MSGQRKRLVLLTLLSLMLGIAIVSQAGLLAEAVQRVFVEKASLSSVALLLALLLSVMAIRTLLLYANGRVGLSMAAEAKAKYAFSRAAEAYPCFHAFNAAGGRREERSVWLLMQWTRLTAISVTTCRGWPKQRSSRF
ncbi:hypothetical protein ACFTAO_15280 [Paenibacillus rhizoplanae]